jgi:hypothetical protein
MYLVTEPSFVFLLPKGKANLAEFAPFIGGVDIHDARRQFRLKLRFESSRFGPGVLLSVPNAVAEELRVNFILPVKVNLESVRALSRLRAAVNSTDVRF